jgi:replicative DNA helicase
MRQPVLDLTDAARDAVRNHQRPARMPEVGTYQQALQVALDKSKRPKAAAGTGKTGIYRLDKLTGGINPKDCWLIGGDTSIGKSTFAVGIGSHNLSHGRGVLVVSSEDPIERYGARFICQELKLSAMRLRDGALKPDELRKVEEMIQRADPWPFYIAADGVPLEDVCQWVEWAIDEYSITGVIWDYLQEFYLARPLENDRLTTKAKAKAMRTIARRTNTWEITLSQVTVSETTKIPTRNNIRDCRDAAHGADVIALLYELERTEEDEDGPQRIGLFLDKAKEGPRKVSIELDWDPYSATFRPMLGQTQEEPPSDLYEFPDQQSLAAGDADEELWP